MGWVIDDKFRGTFPKAIVDKGFLISKVMTCYLWQAF